MVVLIFLVIRVVVVVVSGLVVCVSFGKLSVVIDVVTGRVICGGIVSAMLRVKPS